jgi:type II secretory pathway component PulF
MQVFNYTVKNEENKTVKGKVEARDERQAVQTSAGQRLDGDFLENGG